MILKNLSVLERMKVLQHQPGTGAALGCGSCIHYDDCGGLSTNHPIFHCLDLCECKAGEPCNAACPRRPERYIELLDDAGGWSLSDLPALPPLGPASLPPKVPVVYHASRRERPLRVDAVAVPLAKVFSPTTGRSRFESRDEFMNRFRIAPTASLILTGVDEDRRIEPYWGVARGAQIVEAIAELRPALVTTPNFSLFSDVPRHDNMVNMRRIAVCWHELTRAGVPTALHVNARTERDWERWAKFIRAQPAVETIAFEFATGARVNNRWRHYVQQLCWLAESVGRPLGLTVRGGTGGLDSLRRGFASVTLLDTTAFSKTLRRCRARRSGSKVKWTRGFSLHGQLLDDLLQHNVEVTRSGFTPQ